MDVVGHNFLSGVENKSTFQTEIDNFAFSYDGKWLATVSVVE